ncbi:MAG: EF-P lysine aminoacylase EpmA [Francisellaceae bacterium]
MLPEIALIRKRADYLKKIRDYFEHLEVVEVDTPLAYRYAVSDPYIDVFAIDTPGGRRFLQSSPEYAMKQLLAAGSGSIYQICKAFRVDPKAAIHNWEFTMLEWYRVGIDHFALMQEMKDLFRLLDPSISYQRLSYNQLFQHYLSINPHQAELSELSTETGRRIGKIMGLSNPSKSDCLDLLFTHCIEPELKKSTDLCFIYHYPKEQAALARIIDSEEGEVAARFEVFYKGVELANGYYELSDSKEQRKRFHADNAVRRAEGKSIIEMDVGLLKALDKLPECSGVALGLDRLIMLLEGRGGIAEVLYCS